MAKRPDLTDFTSLVNQTTVVAGLNANNEEIKQAFDNTLSRDGSTPNSMEADLDMNGNKILNLPEPTEDTDPVTKGYGDDNYGGAAAARAEAAADSAEGFRDEAEGFRNEAEDFKDAAEVAADRAESAPERFIGTSTTPNTIGVGSKTFTTQEDLFFNPGGFVLIVDAAAPTTNYMHGNIVNYTGTSLQVNVTNTDGSGTLSDWVIAVSGTRGAEGPQGPAGSGAGDLLAANNLSDLADIPTAVSTLGLTIGTNVQAYDALLQAIAALTTSNGQLIKTTGTDTVVMIPITTAGENLLDDADAAAQRTTLGLGTAAVATLIDDDTMATATATNIPSAESVKAYVDTNSAKVSVARLSYTVAANTAGYSLTSGAFRTVPVNTEDFDPDGIVTLSSNQFTLAAGTYMIHCIADINYGTSNNNTKARLYNVTDSTNVLLGSTTFATPNQGTGVPCVVGAFTIGASKALEFQIRVSANTTATAASNYGISEVYTQILITKVG